MNDWPPEFFTPDELARLLGTRQRARQVALLKRQQVPFICSAAGRPLVYRDKLLPSAHTAHNSDLDFDYDAARATRKATKRRESRPTA